MATLRIFDLQTAAGRDDTQTLKRLWHSGGVTAQQNGVDVPQVVREILNEVRHGGDHSAAQLTSRLDGANIDPLRIRVSEEELSRAHSAMDEGFLKLIRMSIESVKRYQEHIQIKQSPWLQGDDKRVGIRYTPVNRVGIYIPGGKALYPHPSS